MRGLGHRNDNGQRLHHKLWILYILTFVLPSGFLLYLIRQLSESGVVSQDAAILMQVGLAVGLPAAFIMSLGAMLLLNHSVKNVQSVIQTVESFLRDFRTMEVSAPTVLDETEQMSHYVTGMVGEFRRHMSAIDRYAEELHTANEQLANQALVDPLTGLYNRKHVLNMLDVEIQRAVRNGGQLSALRISSKQLATTPETDTQRDEAINRIGKAIAGHLRRVDIVSHLGDGQFLALLLETGSEGAQIVATRMRERISSQQDSAAPIRKTYIGVVTHKGEENANMLMARAEQELTIAEGMPDATP